jgi:hypothetical protein
VWNFEKNKNVKPVLVQTIDIELPKFVSKFANKKKSSTLYNPFLECGLSYDKNGSTFLILSSRFLSL